MALVFIVAALHKPVVIKSAWYYLYLGYPLNFDNRLVESRRGRIGCLATQYNNCFWKRRRLIHSDLSTEKSNDFIHRLSIVLVSFILNKYSWRAIDINNSFAWSCIILIESIPCKEVCILVNIVWNTVISYCLDTLYVLKMVNPKNLAGHLSRKGWY